MLILTDRLCYTTLMFEKYLEKILKEVLGEFIEEVDAKELSVGVWSGKVDIKCLKLKRSIFRKLHQPLNVVHSSIRGLSLKIPWKNLFGSPLMVTIDSVLLLCEFEGDAMPSEERAAEMLALINATIKQVGQELVERGKEKAELKEKSGLIDRFLYKMLDNLYLSIGNVHLRFQQKGGKGIAGYSFGCSLESVQVFAVGPNNQKVFVDRSKLQPGETLLRKKLEMRNLSIYCNYRENQFIGDKTVFKGEKQIQDRLKGLVYRREGFNSSLNRSNYILIMNVVGALEEDHKQTVRYDLALNFEKLIVKLDKEVLIALLSFAGKLNLLARQQNQALTANELGQADELLLRKYCNAFISDFRIKEGWSAKDKDQLASLLSNLREDLVTEKVKYIVVNQMSVTELAKFFALKAQDLDKGLLEVSKQIKNAPQPKIKVSLSIPQITLYLVNEFSQSILELNFVGLSLNYSQRMQGQARISCIQAGIVSISASNNNLYMLSVEKDNLTDKFMTCRVEMDVNGSSVQADVASFNFHYDFETVYKINELFHLKQVDRKYRDIALDKMGELETKVNNRVATTSNLTLKITLHRPRLFVREGKYNWSLQLADLKLSYASSGQWKLQAIYTTVVSMRDLQEYTFIEPLNLTVSGTPDSPISIDCGPIKVHFSHFIFGSLSNLRKYLFVNKKNQIISKCNKSGQIFLKQKQWKKCFLTLLQGHLYGWQNDNDYPLFHIRLRFIRRLKKGKVDILEISDKKKIFQIACRETNMLEQWQTQLQKIVSLQNSNDEIAQPISTASSIQAVCKIQCLKLKIVHHAYNKEEKRFQKIVDGQTNLHIEGIRVNYEDLMKGQQRRNVVNLTVEDVQFGQNSFSFIKSQKKQHQSFLNIQVLFNTGQQAKPEQIINITVADFFFDYRPSSILRLLGFFNQVQTNNQIPDNNYQQRLQKQNLNKILLQLNLYLGKTTILLQNKVINMPIARVTATSAHIKLIIKYYEMIASGTVTSVSLFDLSNYPNTVYLPHSSQVVEKLIVQHASAQNSIKFSMQLYSQGCDKIVDNIRSRAFVEINQLKLNYIHEVVLRLIDYLNVQILGLVFYPQFFPQYEGKSDMTVDEHLKPANFLKEQKDLIKTKYLNKLGKQKVNQMTYTDKPLHFNVHLFNSILSVISTIPNEGIQLAIRQVKITNTCEIKSRKENLKQLLVPFDIYIIDMIDIEVVASEETILHVLSEKIGSQNSSARIEVKYFGKEMDLKYMFGQNVPITGEIEVSIDVAHCKLALNQQSLTCLRKAINNNIFHEDGLAFVMYYEHIPPAQSKLNVYITCDLLILQLQLLQQTDLTLIEMGRFAYIYSREPSTTRKCISTQYAIVSYSNDRDNFTQVLTSRKIFGRTSNRGTLYTSQSPIKQLGAFSNENAIKYESVLQKKSGKLDYTLFGQELMLIVNLDCAICLHKIGESQKDIPVQQPVFIDSITPIKSPMKPKQDTQIKLDKILLCYKVPYNDIIISVLSSIFVNIAQGQISMTLPDLQAFISNEQHISCGQITQMKKRTLLRPTHLQFTQNPQLFQIKLSKCFFKLSINDIKSLAFTYEELRVKYEVFAKLQRESSRKTASLNEKVEKISTPDKNKIKIETNKSIELSYEFKPTPKKIIQGTHEEIKSSLLIIKENRASLQGHDFDVSSIEQMEPQRKVYLDTVEIMVVDDLNEFLTPLLYINCVLDLSQPEKANIELYADYFNLRNTFWQPLIEKTGIRLNWTNGLTIESAQSPQFININVASNFIQNVLKTINHKELKSSRLIYTSHKVDKDEINSWILINQLGEDLTCGPLQSSNESMLRVGNGQAITLPFLAKQTVKEFKEKENDQIYLRIVVGGLTIRKLKINQMGLRKLTVGIANRVIVRSLFVDLSKNIKYLTLASEVIFENKSNIPIRFQLAKQRYLFIKPGESISPPYYCGLECIRYSSKEEQEYYDSLYGLEKMRNITIAGRCFNVQTVSKKLRKCFTFSPLYKITNYLPFPLTIHFKQREVNHLYTSIELGSHHSAVSNFDYLYRPLEELSLSLQIDNYQCTEFTNVSPSLKVKDYHNNPLTIRCEIYRQNSPMQHLAFLVKYVLLNKTTEQFDAIVDRRWLKGIAPQQNFISENDSIILVQGGQKSETIHLQKNTSKIAIRNQSSADATLFHSEILFCIFKNKIYLEGAIYGKTCFDAFEILPMYHFKNDHSEGIYIRQQGVGVGQTQRIPAKSSRNVIFFLDHNSKRRTGFFRITLQASTFDWSCLLSLEYIRNSYFLIRNKFDYMDIRYCCLSVRKIKETFHINFKQLNSSEIPYIIKNQTQNYTILVDNLKSSLRPNEETFFSWDDPNYNHKIIKVRLIREKELKKQVIAYEIKVDSFEQYPLKSCDGNLQMQVVNQFNRQIFIFTDQPKEQRQAVQTGTVQMNLPLRIAIINNSSSPANHLCDLKTSLHLKYHSFSTGKIQALVKLKTIQLDNQTKPLTYFPVVLSTEMTVKIEKSKYLEVELQAQSIKLSIQEDFISDMTLFIAHLKSLTQPQQNSVLQQPSKDDTFFISKLILPKLTIQLEIQSKKFSIETTINLQKPQITSYPWKQLPYPVRTIAINILSHLSISPWAFITSFGKGLTMLLTEQETTRGFEGFFQQLIGGCSNSINGMIGMIVGHDIEKVDNFIDGLTKGVAALGASLFEILPNFQGDYSTFNILKEVGSSAVNLVFKPVTGILRMTLRISEGIKKTTKFDFALGSKKFKTRLPIVFYQREQTFRSYVSVDSQLMNSLKRGLGSELRYFYLIELIPLEYKLRNDRLCLSIGNEQLILYDLKRQKLVWKAEFEHINEMQIHNLCTLHIYLRQTSQEMRRQRLEVDTNNQQLVRRIVDIVDKAKKASAIEL